jgi:2-polyprenyl-6-methoxyphenol hydroxylase-like FAD-dependent oxidoreductase
VTTTAPHELDRLLADVLARIDTSDPRLAEIVTSAVSHLHAIVAEVRPTEDEWLRGIDFLVRVGQACTPVRNELILLSDMLGLTSAVDDVNNAGPAGATPSSVEGPFHSPAPARPIGARIADGPERERAEPMEVHGRVTDCAGVPITGATVDVWQADDAGHYDTQAGRRAAGRSAPPPDAPGTRAPARRGARAPARHHPRVHRRRPSSGLGRRVRGEGRAGRRAAAARRRGPRRGVRRPAGRDMTHYPVLIAGGGPSGLAAALELGRAGIRCCVVEPRVDVDTDRPRAKTTSARTMELFRRWGLADRVRAAAPLPVSYAQDVVFCTRLTGREITRFTHAFGLHDERRDEFAESGQQIPQPAVERVLREAVAELACGDVRYGHHVAAVEDGPGGVRARVLAPDGTVGEIGADYLLGCDGASGVCRDAIGARFAGSSGERPNLSVTFTATGLTEESLCGRAVHYWVLGAEPGGIVGRMDLDGTWWAIGQGTDAGADPVALVRGLVGADVEVEVVATDPWAARMLLVDHYRGQRAFLVGDAAHLNPPWGGHGYNTCIGDAVNVAWKLAAVLQGWAGPALLDSYEPERRPVAAATVADAAAQDSRPAGRFAHPALAHDTPEGERVRASVAEALEAKRGEFHSLGLVLGYHYAGSPVVVDDGSPVPAHEPLRYHGSARPGARLPHRWLPDGSSLFDHLGPGFTVLRLDPAVDVTPFRIAADGTGTPLTVLDLPGLPHAADYGAALLLVRPDQHVAWRGDHAAAAALDTARGADPIRTTNPLTKAGAHR